MNRMITHGTWKNNPHINRAASDFTPYVGFIIALNKVHLQLKPLIII